MKQLFTDVVVLLLLTGCAVQIPRHATLQIRNSYPRLMMSKQDISMMRKNALSGKEPFESCYKKLVSNCKPALDKNWLPKPYSGDQGYPFFVACQRDGGMARDLAILWHITRDNAYYDAALNIIDAWVSLPESPGIRINDSTEAGNGGMLATRGIFPFLYAYDLLMAEGKVPSAISSKFEAWLRALVPVIKEGERRWEWNNYYDRQYFQNHIAAAATGLLAIAVTIRDKELAQYAFDSRINERDVHDLVQGCIFMEGEKPYYREPEGHPVHDGEVYDRYRHFSMGGHYKDYVSKADRGLQYCTLTATLLVIDAEICRNNGYDLYGWTGENGEQIPLIWKHYAHYYATHDCAGSIYQGEEWFINSNDQASSSFWEIAHCRFPGEPAFLEVLNNNDRIRESNLHLFGPVVLTHGRN